MRQTQKPRIVNLLMLTVAGMINAFGITLFMTPVKLYDSGISGTSMLLEQITPSYLSLSLFLLILNIPLFLVGLKKQGGLFTDIFPIDVSIASPLAGTDLLLCALFGGVISGIGSGLAIRYGGAMDGIEVMAVIFAKRAGVTVGTFVMVYNIILYIICGCVLQSWVLPLYSIVAYSAALKTVDFIVEGIDRAKCAIIVTEWPHEICKALTETFGSGITRVSAKGGYSNRDKAMLYFVVNRYQVIRMKDIVHDIDPAAFIIISEVADIFSSNNE